MKSKRNVKVRKRKNGVFEIRYSKGGKQFSIYATTIFECREKYSKQIEVENKQKRHKKILFQTWFDSYITLFKKDFLKPNTLKNLIGLFRLHILPYIAKKPLSSINSIDIQNLLNRMQKTPRQATIVYMQLRACFEKAFQLGLIRSSPCDAVVINKHKGNKGRALTIEEQARLIEYLNTYSPPIKNLILIYLTTGMRRSELLNIKYSDLNFKDNEILVRGEKTKNAFRVIQVPSKVLQLFPKKDLPFAEWSADKVDRHFKIITTALGFKGITIHSLRHTFATNCISSGVNMVVVQKWLGHANISMTIDTYTHIEKEFLKGFADSLDYDFLL